MTNIQYVSKALLSLADSMYLIFLCSKQLVSACRCVGGVCTLNTGNFNRGLAHVDEQAKMNNVTFFLLCH